jgi:Fe-Mn family superoxide dismutase
MYKFEINFSNNLNKNIMAFELPQLPYAYDALEPHIDARTMEIHHSKHHNAYTTNLNAAIAGTDLEGKYIEEIIKNLEFPKNIKIFKKP